MNKIFFPPQGKKLRDTYCHIRSRHGKITQSLKEDKSVIELGFLALKYNYLLLFHFIFLIIILQNRYLKCNLSIGAMLYHHCGQTLLLVLGK